jgi:flagellar biosynthesis/type III secretory pathway M-ring protein FliF/YscJ
MMEFLYFPEDKTEYIPAFIALAICIILAYVAFKLIKAYSKSQEKKMKNFEEDVMKKLEEEQPDDKKK